MPKRLARTLRDRDAGFSLIEVMVAITVLAIAAAAVLPALVFGQRVNTISRDQTQAKNLAQEKLENLKQLGFWTAIQNQPAGTEVDLLDTYFPNLSVSSGPLATSSTYVDATTATAARPAGEPGSGAYYRTYNASLGGSLSRFSETVTLQFLTQDAAGATTRVTPSSTYDSDVVGADSPPSRLVDARVIIRWTYAGQVRDYRVASRIADADTTKASAGQALTGQRLGLQARGQAVRIVGASSSTELFLEAATASADGATGSASTATGSAEGASFGVTGSATQTLRGSQNSVGAPPAAVTTGTTLGGQTYPADCSIGCFGPTSTDGESASITNGLPLVGGAPTASSANPVLARITRRGACSGNNCLRTTKGFALSGYPVVSNAGLLLSYPNNGSYGVATLADAPTGSADSAQATAHVNANATTATAISTAATQVVDLVPTTYSQSATTAGLVRVKLDSASLTCAASTGGTPTVTASYSGTLWYWGELTPNSFGYTAVPFSYANGTLTGGALPTLTNVVVYRSGSGRNSTTLYLSDYFTSLSIASAPSATIDSVNGTARAQLSAVRVSTQPLTAGDANSTWSATVGDLSCTAQDAR